VARNWPFGSALSFAVMVVMLLAHRSSTSGRGRRRYEYQRRTGPKPVERLLATNAWLVFAFFYLPILILIVFSFNDNNNVGVWTEPRLAGTGDVRNSDVMGALRNSLIVALRLHRREHVLGDDAGASRWSDSASGGRGSSTACCTCRSSSPT
jgi:ABC-type Fe3+ transport system permease subunit